MIMMLPDGTVVPEGTVSISLNDSWTGRQLLEGLGHVPVRVCVFIMYICDLHDDDNLMKTYKLQPLYTFV